MELMTIVTINMYSMYMQALYTYMYIYIYEHVKAYIHIYIYTDVNMHMPSNGGAGFMGMSAPNFSPHSRRFTNRHSRVRDPLAPKATVPILGILSQELWDSSYLQFRRFYPLTNSKK